MISYLITDPKYYTNDPNKFSQILNESLKKNHVDIACFRDKVSLNQIELSLIFFDICKKHKIKKIIINSNINFAFKYKFDGVHLTSSQLNQIRKAKSLNLFVITSSHNNNELTISQKYGANMTTFSPIFSTPDKNKPLGCEYLKKIINQYKIPIIALGGIISEEHLSKIRAMDAYGFASIRFFCNKNIKIQDMK